MRRWRTVAFWAGVGGVAALYVLFCLVGSARKALWFDELFTLYVAQSESAGAIWARLRDGMDNHPPLYYWLGHASLSLFGPSALALRLPAMLGVALALYAVYAFVRHRADRAYGLLAVALLMWSVTLPFAFEARGYGLLLGLAAAALVSWQRAAEPRSWPGTVAVAAALFVTVSAALWTHYYAVLLFVPLGLGEVTRTLERRRMHAPTLVALAAAALNVVPLLAFVRATNQGFSNNFWAAPGSPFEIVTAYQQLFEHLLVPVGLVLLLLLASPLVRGRAPSSQRVPPRVPRAEIVACAGLLACPAVMWLMAVTVTHAFYFRYALFTVIGACLLVPLGLAARGPSRLGAVAAAALIALLPVGLERHRQVITNRRAHELMGFAARQLDAHGGVAVVDDGIEYLLFHHHAGPALRGRLFHLLDAEATLRIMGNDTFPRAFMGLARYRDVQAVDLRGFLAQRPRFLVLSRAGYRQSWILPRLLEHPALRVTLVAREGEQLAYLVSRR